MQEKVCRYERAAGETCEHAIGGVRFFDGLAIVIQRHRRFSV